MGVEIDPAKIEDEQELSWDLPSAAPASTLR
jgi:hypothetical protein